MGRRSRRSPIPTSLFLHQTGQWAKKVRGRTHYFGTDVGDALTKYLEQRENLQAGRTPRILGEDSQGYRAFAGVLLVFKE
jgi:hypothetical protein